MNCVRTVVAGLAIMLLMRTGASAQPAPPPLPPLSIEQADIENLREILETTIPPRYNGALVRFYTDLVRRQQAALASPPGPPGPPGPRGPRGTRGPLGPGPEEAPAPNAEPR